MTLLPEQKHQRRLLAYLAGFFLNLSTAVGAYINSSFIEQFVGEQRVGLVYAAAALVSLIVSWQALSLIRRFGNQRTIIFFGSANLAVLVGIVALNGQPASVWLVAAYIILSFLTAINLDVYLEELSDDRVTGRIRGLFLTTVNLAWLASPALASNLTARFGYSAVYLIGAIALLPFVYLVAKYLKDVMARQEEHLSLGRGLARLLTPASRDLRRILFLDFLLNFFYATMIIYMPIYLHEHIGLSWPQIGLVFTVMLLPFVILDFPLGRLADLRWGEKELLTVGLVVIAFSCFLIAPIITAATAVWAAILFTTRVGAATVEAMKETYFFKHIDGRDANIIFISRNMYPLAYVLAPIAASAFLLFWPLSHLFSLLGLVMLIGLPVSLRLKDTR